MAPTYKSHLAASGEPAEVAGPPRVVSAAMSPSSGTASSTTRSRATTVAPTRTGWAPTTPRRRRRAPWRRRRSAPRPGTTTRRGTTTSSRTEPWSVAARCATPKPISPWPFVGMAMMAVGLLPLRRQRAGGAVVGGRRAAARVAGAVRAVHALVDAAPEAAGVVAIGATVFWYASLVAGAALLGWSVLTRDRPDPARGWRRGDSAPRHRVHPQHARRRSVSVVTSRSPLGGRVTVRSRP